MEHARTEIFVHSTHIQQAIAAEIQPEDTESNKGDTGARPYYNIEYADLPQNRYSIVAHYVPTGWRLEWESRPWASSICATLTGIISSGLHLLGDQTLIENFGWQSCKQPWWTHSHHYYRTSRLGIFLHLVNFGYRWNWRDVCSNNFICYPAHSLSGISDNFSWFREIWFRFNVNNHHDTWISGLLHNVRWFTS